jgi:hypothetical protein
MMRDLDDDDVLPYTRPLDLALVLDGHNPDDPPEDQDHLEDEQHVQVDAQDGAGDGFEAEGDGEDGEPESGLERGVREPWVVVLAERDASGAWRTIGEPVPNAVFDDMSTAHLWAENRNKRHFGHRFDWANDPPKAWITARVGQIGAVRVNDPLPVPVEDKPMVADLDEDEEEDDSPLADGGDPLADWERCGST